VLPEERRKLIRARKMRNLRNQLEGQNFGFDRTVTKRELWEMEDEVEDEEQEQESKRTKFDYRGSRWGRCSLMTVRVDGKKNREVRQTIIVSNRMD
jgi:hypothetical protein